MKNVISTILISCVLSACGGGGGSGSTGGGAATPPVAVKQRVIVCIGDSETAGAVSQAAGGFINMPDKSYPAVLQTLVGTQYRVINLGVNSSNLLEVEAQQVAAAVASHPDILIIGTSLNDAGDRIPFETLKATYARIQAQMPTTTIWTLTPLRNSGIPDDVLKSYRDFLYTLPYKAIDVGFASNASWYCGNSDIHPCEVGYSQMAKVIYSNL